MNQAKVFTIILIASFLFPIFSQKVSSASFDFNPATTSFPASCDQSVNVFVDATGQSSNGADLEVIYDPTQIEILDSDPDRAGIQVKNGNAYDLYVYNQVTEATGRIKVAGASFTSALTSRKLFATIEFRSKPGATFVNLQVRTDGFGSTVSLDSNIADSNTNLDILSSVTNGTYTFTASPCSADTTGPGIVFISPEPYDTDVVAPDGVNVTITDASSGIDIGTVSIVVNGVTYTYNSPGVTYTGNPNSYTFTIVPNEAYPTDTAITAVVTASDFAGNESVSQMIFNVPAGTPISCPASYLVTEGVATNFCSIEEERILTNVFGKESVVYRVVTDIGSTGAIAVLIGLTSALGLLPLLNTPLLLAGLLGASMGRKNKNPMGIVLDEVTRAPITLAICKLYKSGTQLQVGASVSDIEGRFGFGELMGSFRLEVTKQGYEKYSYELELSSSSNGSDVLLRPKANVSRGFGPLSILSGLWNAIRKYSSYLLFTGFVLSGIALVVHQNLFNLIILIIYILCYVAMIYSKLRKGKRTSFIKNSVTKTSISNAIIKVFDVQGKQLKEIMVTDKNGAFEFNGEAGEYAILVSTLGYVFPSLKQPTAVKVSDRLLKVQLQKGDNNMEIMVDPVDDSSKYVVSGNLPNPY